MKRPALLTVLRAWPEAPERLPRDLSAADENALVRDAAHHGLPGLVQHALQSADIHLSPSAAEDLKRQSLFSASLGLRVKMLLLRVLDALAAVGITPVLLKGYGLAARLYPDPLLRSTSDVDLLVRREELGRAEEAIRKLGLAPKQEADDFYPIQYRYHLSFEGGGNLVELHFRAMTSYGIAWEADELLARSLTAEIEGRSVRFLRPEDELVYLALHAANHMLQRVTWLYDLKLLVLRHPKLDWSEVARVARSTRTPSSVYYALEASQRAVAAPVPEVALRTLAPSALKKAIARRAFAEKELVAGSLARHKPLWAAAKILLSDSYGRIALFTARRVSWIGNRELSRRWRRMTA